MNHIVTMEDTNAVIVISCSQAKMPRTEHIITHLGKSGKICGAVWERVQVAWRV